MESSHAQWNPLRRSWMQPPKRTARLFHGISSTKSHWQKDAMSAARLDMWRWMPGDHTIRGLFVMIHSLSLSAPRTVVKSPSDHSSVVPPAAVTLLTSIVCTVPGFTRAKSSRWKEQAAVKADAIVSSTCWAAAIKSRMTMSFETTVDRGTFFLSLYSHILRALSSWTLWSLLMTRRFWYHRESAVTLSCQMTVLTTKRNFWSIGIKIYQTFNGVVKLWSLPSSRSCHFDISADGPSSVVSNDWHDTDEHVDAQSKRIQFRTCK